MFLESREATIIEKFDMRQKWESELVGDGLFRYVVDICGKWYLNWSRPTWRILYSLPCWLQLGAWAKVIRCKCWIETRRRSPCSILKRITNYSNRSSLDRDKNIKMIIYGTKFFVKIMKYIIGKVLYTLIYQSRHTWVCYNEYP